MISRTALSLISGLVIGRTLPVLVPRYVAIHARTYRPRLLATELR